MDLGPGRWVALLGICVILLLAVNHLASEPPSPAPESTGTLPSLSGDSDPPSSEPQPTVGGGEYTFMAWGSDAEYTVDVYVRVWGDSWKVRIPANGEVESRLDLECINGMVSVEFSVLNPLDEEVGWNFYDLDCAGHTCWWAHVQKDGTYNEWGEPQYRTAVLQDYYAPKDSCA